MKALERGNVVAQMRLPRPGQRQSDPVRVAVAGKAVGGIDAAAGRIVVVVHDDVLGQRLGREGISAMTGCVESGLNSME